MKSRILLSPSEVALADLFKDEAITSSVPEERGADVIVLSKNVNFYFQRKEVPHDFISSITDGRMARATSLLGKQEGYVRMICEGRFKFYPDGTLALGTRIKSRWSFSQIQGMLLDIEYIKNIPVMFTEDLQDTYDYLKRLMEWSSRSKHLGLYSRPSAKGAWYVPTALDTHLWLLQSFPGIGPQMADNIISHFGKIPLAWTCSVDEMAKVPRLGYKRASKMFEVLEEKKTSLDELRKKLR